jgi:hypothetical protein
MESMCRADGGGKTKDEARSASYHNLVNKLVPATKLSCLTEFFACPNSTVFMQNYGNLYKMTEKSYVLDIFSAPDLESLYDQVTNYAANYATLVSDLIRSLLPDSVPVEVRLDTVNGLWAATVTLGTIVIGVSMFIKLKMC